MGEKEKRLQSFRAFGAVFSMIISAVSQALNIFSIWPQAKWNVVAIVSFVMFCVFVWLMIRNLESQLNSKIPKIDIFGDPIPHDVGMGHTTKDGNFEVAGISNMAAALFSNNPKPITDQNSAKGVRAEITYLDKSRKILLGPIQGRWGQTSQPSEIKKYEGPLIESVDFPNNGAMRSLDFLIKYPEDDYCYAFNNDSYDFPYLFQNPLYIIKQKAFIVNIRLKGPFISENPFEFEVITKGKNDTYMIRKRDGEWQKLLNSQATKSVSPQKNQKRPNKKAFKPAT
jgi:hypothetical protein